MYALTRVESASSDLASIYGSLPSYFNGRKSIIGTTKTSKKTIATNLKDTFIPRANPIDFKAVKPDATNRQNKSGDLTTAESNRSTLETGNFNLNVNSRFLTKLKDTVFSVLGNFNNRFKTDSSYGTLRDSFSGSKGNNNSSKGSSNQTKTSSKGNAKSLTDGIKDILKNGSAFFGKRSSFLGNLGQLLSLKSGIPNKKASLRQAEIVLITVKHNKLTVSDVSKMDLLSKIDEFKELKDGVDTAIHDISMKPEVVRDTPNTTRQQNARQDALDNLYKKVAELDSLVSSLRSSKDSINTHILQKLVIRVIGVIGGITKADTRVAEGYSSAKNTYGGLKGSTRDGKRESFDRAKGLKDGPRDTSRKTFKPNPKPGDRPSDSQIRASKAFVENLKRKVAELKILSAKEGLSDSIIKKYAEIASLTEAYRERLKTKADPSLKNDASLAKKRANDDAQALKPADTPNKDTYDKIKNDIRKLNQRAADLAAKMRDIQRDKSLSVFDKDAKLKEYREALDKLKIERDNLNDRIENLENDLRRIQKELDDPNLDPKRRKELKDELDAKMKNRDNLKNEIKDANDKIRDIEDKLARIKRENSALNKLKKFLNGLKNGAVGLGLNLVPILAGIGVLGLASLPFVFASPVVPNPIPQPVSPDTPKTPDTDRANYLNGRADGYSAGIQDGTANGSADGLKEAQRQYSVWVSQNPEDTSEISMENISSNNSNAVADEGAPNSSNNSVNEDEPNNSENSS
jgi:predicted  nucleic acid-binding Zn-ribbon protein